MYRAFAAADSGGSGLVLSTAKTRVKRFHALSACHRRHLEASGSSAGRQGD